MPRDPYRKTSAHNDAEDTIRRTTVWLGERDIAWLKAHGGIAKAVRRLIKHARIGEGVVRTRAARAAGETGDE